MRCDLLDKSTGIEATSTMPASCLLHLGVWQLCTTMTLLGGIWLTELRLYEAAQKALGERQWLRWTLIFGILQRAKRTGKLACTAWNTSIPLLVAQSVKQEKQGEQKQEDQLEIKGNKYCAQCGKNGAQKVAQELSVVDLQREVRSHCMRDELEGLKSSLDLPLHRHRRVHPRRCPHTAPAQCQSSDYPPADRPAGRSLC